MEDNYLTLIDSKEFQTKVLDYITSEDFDEAFNNTIFADKQECKGAMLHGMCMAAILTSKCKSLVVIPSGSVLTKEQTEALYEFAKTPVDIDEKFLEKFNSIGCTSFQLTANELKEILEKE